MEESGEGFGGYKKYIFSLIVSLMLPVQSFAAGAPLMDVSATSFSLASGVFMTLVMFLVITLVATEKVHRTLVVFFIASSLIFLNYTFGYFIPELRFLSLEQAFKSIDGEVIALLVGMMMIVGVLAQTRLFEWFAVKMFEFSRGSMTVLFFSFFVITAIFSAFLDNVTTIFLITPVAIAIAKIFEMNPVRLVIPMVIASNLGGAATLIGDPPNIMIGSYAGLTFNQFLFNLGLPVIVISAIIMISLYVVMGKELRNTKKIENFHETVNELKAKYPIKHKKLLIASLSVLALVIIFFFLHGFFHMPAAVPAVMGAALLMLIRDRLIRKRFGRTQECREMMEHRIHDTFSKDVEWLVIGFFIFLFMIVGAVEHTGLLHLVAIYIQETFGDNLLLCALAILWLAAIFSTALDNIPFTAVMLPVVATLVQFYADQGIDATFLWWALAFGACFGGNGSLIGASANLVAAGLLEKEKYHLSFMEFFKLSFPLMLLQVTLASVAVYLMYLGTYM
ncbi:ArsB/NhaD family transporter [Candidatus Gracilibacteria bacterium]|nr:ArsB/NhaD family transporter [Candidatus Gracilibacteria bacterium]